FVRALTRRALGRFDAVVAVSTEVADGLGGCVVQDRVHIIPAFLAPESAGAGLASLDADAERLLEQGPPTLVVSCSKLPSRSGATDLYGADVAVGAFRALAPERPLLRLALFLGRAPRDHAER